MLLISPALRAIWRVRRNAKKKWTPRAREMSVQCNRWRPKRKQQYKMKKEDFWESFARAKANVCAFLQNCLYWTRNAIHLKIFNLLINSPTITFFQVILLPCWFGIVEFSDWFFVIGRDYPYLCTCARDESGL
jgi:hypothetical protein